MTISDILASIDHEITQLQLARALLGGGAATTAKKKAGRPKKAVAVAAPAAAKPAKKKRKLSPEGRKRIVEALKRRWAATRKAGVAVVPAAKTPAKKKAAAVVAPATTKPAKKKAAAVIAPVAAKPAKKKKRSISPEGRKRIAEAVKKRWAAQKAAAAVVPATTEP